MSTVLGTKELMLIDRIYENAAMLPTVDSMAKSSFFKALYDRSPCMRYDRCSLSLVMAIDDRYVYVQIVMFEFVAIDDRLFVCV